MRLALGTVQFGLKYGIANKQGLVSFDEAKKILEYAFPKGIDTLDTAFAYGRSEQILGEIGVQRWQIVSKVPSVPEGCGDVFQWVNDCFNESLQRLKVKNLYGLLLHRPKQLLEPFGNQLYQSLLGLKESGLVQRIGVSIYDPTELDMFWYRYSFDIVQAPFSIFDRRLINTSWLPRLADQGTEVHIRSIFLQGLLLMEQNNRPLKFNQFLSLWSQWDSWLKETGYSPLQACICFALSFQEISKVIIGVDSLSQMKDIIDAIESPLPNIPAELQSTDPNLLNPDRWNFLL